MNTLQELLNLSAAEKENRGVVHTPQEIAQQPETWKGTWQLVKSQLPAIQKFLTATGVGPEAKERATVFLVGAGTSDYIGHCLHHLLRQKWQCEVIPVASTDLLTDFSETLLEGQRYLWISFSRSGDSPESVAVIERAIADRPDIAHLIVTCNESGKMIRMVRDRENGYGIVLAKETNDGGLAMTSSFTNMTLTGQALAHAWSPEEYDPIAAAISEAGTAFLPIAAETAAKLAGEGFKRACFVGSTAMAGASKEAALKLLELTAGEVKTMSQATLALRHGPMAALDRDTLFVSFLSTQTKRQRYEIDLLREIERKELVKQSIAVAGSGTVALPSLEKTLVLGPAKSFEVPDLYRPVTDILFGQLLGLFSSVACGLTPDTPSPNGAITRVVQPIEIH